MPPPPSSGGFEQPAANAATVDLLGEADDLLGPSSPFEEAPTAAAAAAPASDEHQFWTEGDLYGGSQNQKPAAGESLLDLNARIEVPDPVQVDEDLSSMLGVQPPATQERSSSVAPPPPAEPAEEEYEDSDDEPPPEAVMANQDDLLDLIDGPSGPKTHQEALEVFFKEHKPENLDKIEKLLSGYAGRESSLYQKLGEKYGVTPAWPEGIPKMPVEETPTKSKSRSRASSKASPAAEK